MDFNIRGFCDAYWANDIGDRSQTEYPVYIEGSLISWGSKKQSTDVVSSTESEFHGSLKTALTVASLTSE